ncbi:polymer-forming cytoskeletal protein [Roseomonas sp. GC11]|uniref:bactofilin family protein n=1 Tax=Roseomonas sp. GC11 TaxID=2950546 RepID=UPI00210D4E7E|nr:polymer-forming cytoskeletal protein [Roseomonas sp. GC11]MCQ4159934.1 polymer-forming cytoskeletal protein [Roseomonas sp. GC11]
MSIFGKPSGGEPRITFERFDLSAEGADGFDNAPLSRPVAERAPPDRSFPDRHFPDRAFPERATPERTLSERALSERTLADRVLAERPAAERLEPRIERARGAAAASPAGTAVMLIAADSEVEGRLRSRGVVRVEGVLRGSIHAPVVLLEAGGLIEGTVTVERAKLCGTLRGTLLAREIEILRTASVDAELVYDEISVERGARVRGLHRQRDPEPVAEPATPELAGTLPTDTLATEALAGAALPAEILPGAAEAAGNPVVLAAAAASTAALVAEAEAALQSLASVSQAAAEAVAELAEEGVTDLVALEAELRAAPDEILLGKPVLGLNPLAPSPLSPPLATPLA